MPSWFSSAALFGASVCVSFALAEWGARAWFGDHGLSPRVGASTVLLRSTYPVDHDPTLGWVPKPGFSSSDNVWRTQVTIRPDGTRSNGLASKALPDSPAILAVGDSFTFGDEVSDTDTWPAALERSLGIRVWNGGVFGYGTDQSSLRWRALLPHVPADLVVLSLIADDLVRTELSERSHAAKPHFALRDGEPVLMGTPLPVRQPPQAPAWETAVRAQLSRSVLIDRSMRLVARSWWVYGRSEGITRVPGSDGAAITCALLSRDSAELAKQGRRFVVMLQYERTELDAPAVPGSRLQRLSDCLAEKAVPVLDLRAALTSKMACHREAFESLYHPGPGHMTAEGNRFVADQLAPVAAAAAQGADPDRLRKLVERASQPIVAPCPRG